MSLNFAMQQVISVISDLQKTSEISYNLFQQMIYGKRMLVYCPQQKSYIRCHFYLNERNPEMMITLHQSGKRQVMDLRRIRMRREDAKLQMEHDQLKDKKYLLVKDGLAEEIVIFSHGQDLQNFWQAMRILSKKLDEVPSQFDPIILKNFIRADTDHNQQLSKSEIKAIMADLKIQYNDDIRNILKYIRKAHKITTDNITYRDFQKLAKTISCRLEMLKVFQGYTKVKSTYYDHYLQGILSKEKFSEFLEYDQHQSDPLRRQEIVEKVFGGSPKINFYDFSQYLVSPMNTAIDTAILNEQQDLDKSLTDYYCYSSHNTYLTGNQLTSDSRAERYWQDLQDGLRCVQLDTHDGSNGPIIKHGFTMTAPVTFLEVIQTINKFCIDNPNHTPIILSIQNHCNNQNQLKMAHCMGEHFKDRVLRVGGHRFPTLRECLGKIIIKASGNMHAFRKYVQIHHQQGSQIEVDSEDSGDDGQGMKQKNFLFSMISDLSSYPENFLKHKKIFDQTTNYLKKDKAKFIKKQKQVQKFIEKSLHSQEASEGKHKLNIKLLSMTSMLGSGKLGEPNCWESVSLSQSKFVKFYENQKEKLILLMHSKVGWLRSYPLASRVDSSNYNPIPALQMGIQIIALNTQNTDPYTLILKRFFDKGKNKATGYRLKSNRIYSDQALDVSNDSNIKKITITALSASKIFYDGSKSANQIPNVQVKMSFLGSHGDMLMNKPQLEHRPVTEVVKANGFSPIFKNAKRFTIRYREPQFSFIFLEIQRCGISVLPLESLRKGYRAVVLYDDQLNVKESKILCLIQ